MSIMQSSSSASPAPSLHARLDPAAIAQHPVRKPTVPGSPMPPSSSLLPDEYEAAASADVTFASAADANDEDDENDEEEDEDDAEGDAFGGRANRGAGGRGGSTRRKGPAAPPPEVEHSLSKLTSHKNVTGCLILSRPEALVIRADGPAFEPGGPGALERSERLVKVVRMVRRAVEVMSKEVTDADEGDDLSFVRIRTKKYEMLISPSDKYLLVVLQDPTIAP